MTLQNIYHIYMISVIIYELVFLIYNLVFTANSRDVLAQARPTMLAFRLVIYFIYIYYTRSTYIYVSASCSRRIRIMLATFLRDVTATFLSVTDTHTRTYAHTYVRVYTRIMRIDPGLESSPCSQLYYFSGRKLPLKNRGRN